MKKLIIFLSLNLTVSVPSWGTDSPEAVRFAGMNSFENPAVSYGELFKPLPAPYEAFLVLPEAKTQNADVRKGYDYILKKQSPDNLYAFKAAQLKSLYTAVYTNKVASLDALPHYDPSGELGFCFGRATAAHLIAKRMGIKDGSVAHMFLIGDLKSGETTEWRFHVTTIVRGQYNTWYSIDPITQGPMSIKNWIKLMRATWDKEKKAKIYITQPDAILPDLRIFPAPNEEKGEGIIELSFDPSGKPGFIPFPVDSEPLVFTVEDKTADKYFLNVHEKPETDSFDFFGITINGDNYDYRNYYVDLIQDIKQSPAPKSDRQLTDKSLAPQTINGLFSPKWGTERQ